MVPATQMLSTFRARAKDDQHVIPRFSIRYRDKQTRSALLEVSNGWFRVTLRNAPQGREELAIPLHDNRFATLGGLLSHIEREYASTYEVARTLQFSETHSSMDLETVVGEDLAENRPVTLHTRLFSDAELLSILQQAVLRHNPGFTLDTVPPAEENLVYQLASAELLRIKGVDASKRRGLEDDPKAMMTQAESYEFAYRQDHSRLRNVIQLPGGSRQTPNLQGEVNQTFANRFSLRRGFRTPSSHNLPPPKPVLLVPDGTDVQDYSVTIRWEKLHELGEVLEGVELWRDTSPDVRRTKDLEVYPTTSVLVWSSRQGGPQSGEAYMTFPGNTRNVTDGYILGLAAAGVPEPSEAQRALQPDTQYYYRLYVFDRNGEYEASDAVPVTTRPARAEFSRNPAVPALSLTEGPRAGGTAVTVRGSSFTDGMRVMIGARDVVDLQVASSDVLTFLTPAAGQRGAACERVTLISASGLKDVYADWRWVP